MKQVMLKFVPMRFRKRREEDDLDLVEPPDIDIGNMDGLLIVHYKNDRYNHI